MRTLNINANGDYDFDNVYTHKPSVIVAQIVTDGTFDGTITFEKKVLGSALARDPALYIDDVLKQVANAVVSGLNLNKIVIIDSAGSKVTAKVTGWTTGVAQIDYVVLEDTFPAFKVAGSAGTPTADVNVVTALPVGNNNIGDVDIASIAAGDNNIGNVDIVTMPNVTIGALPAVDLSVATLAALETIQIGSIVPVALDAATLAALESITIGTALPAGGNNIGIVDLSAAALAALETIQIGSLPNITIGAALPVGNNNIGDVDIATLPAVALDAATLAALESITIGTALPVGANVIGKVDINSSVALALDAATLAALETIQIGSIAAGANLIGKVDVNSITAGDTRIGRVKLTDDTNLATIRAGSSGAAVADTAVVVAQRPILGNPTVVGGLTTASAAAAVIADTGALAAGTYDVECSMANAGIVAAGKQILLEHRNAANGATLFTLAACPATGAYYGVFKRVVVALNERLRVINGAVAQAAGEVATGSIRAHLIT